MKAGDAVRIVPVYMEFREGRSSKFWEIAMTGPKTWTTAWGRIGSVGRSTQRVCGSHYDAVEDYNKLMRLKKSEGYVRVRRPSSRATVEVEGFKSGMGLLLSLEGNQAKILNDMGRSEMVRIECLEVVFNK